MAAFEVARQLQASGQHVGLLVLIGTASPASFRLTNRLRGSAKEWVRDRAAGMKAWLNADRAERTRRVKAKVARFSDSFGTTPPARADSAESSRARVEEATIKAARAYQPGRYVGRITVCLSNRAEERSDECFVDWGRFATGGAEIMAGPDRCEHDFMLREPDVRVFAEYLRRSLTQSAGVNG